MFILDFLRYTRGYVTFTASGVFTERFLNLCARDHIAIWDGRKSGDTYTGCVMAGQYRRLRVHAKKTGVKLRLSKKQGMPFKRRKYRKRKGLLIGLAFFSAFLFIMSRFIWRIDVRGEGTVPESTIISALESIGITPGTLRSSIDVRDSERRAMLLLHDLSWVALNIEGSAIYVEYSKSTSPPPVIDPGSPCNVIAAASGQIIKLNVYDGQALVSEGDTVLKGDLIVSGITKDRYGQNLFKHAQAQALARVIHTIEIAVPLEQTEYIETGVAKSRTYLSVMGFEIPLFLPFKIPPPYHVNRSQKAVTAFSIGTPLTILREEYTLMEEVPVTLTNEEARGQALLELAAAEKSELGSAKIHERNTGVEIKNGHYILRAEYICDMDIAAKQAILVGE